jgi:MFS family permease
MTGPEADPRTLRPIAGVLSAIAVSWTGTRISAIALPWFVLVTTGSATRTGLVAFCEMAPYAVVKALTGPLVDRAGPRVVSWTTDLLSAGTTGAVVVLHTLSLLSFPLLLGLVALIGAARGPGDLAKTVMVPEAADRGRMRLEQATGLAGVTERLAATIGPAAGGALIAIFGAVTGLLLDAGCFVLGSVIIALALPRGVGRPAAPTPSGGREPGYWHRLGQGVAFLRGEHLLLAVFVMVAVTNFLEASFSTVLMPVWAKESGNGPAAIGLNGGVMGMTAIGGSLIATAVAHRLRRRLVFFAGFLVAGAPRFLVLASHAPMWSVLTVFAVSGFGGGFLNPIVGAVAFERVPRPLLGRVNALGDSLAWAGIPLGGLVAGSAVASFGLVPVLLIGGGAYFLTTSLTGLRPEWREMDRPADVTSDRPGRSVSRASRRGRRTRCASRTGPRR